MTDSILRKAKALQTLAAHPDTPEAERQLAQEVLRRLVEKHGLDLAALEEPPRHLYKFSYINTFERDLIRAILFKVLDAPSFTWSNDKSRRIVYIELTAAEEATAKQQYAVYRKALAEHLRAAFEAFILKNKITSGKGTAQEVDLEWAQRVVDLMKATARTPVHLALAEKSG